MSAEDSPVVDIRWALRRRRSKERREFNRMVSAITDEWYADCPTHGRLPVDPMNDGMLVCGLDRTLGYHTIEGYQSE